MLHRRKKITIFDHDDGSRCSDKEAREFLNKALADGKRVIPMNECYRFDFQKGCPGHIISLMPNEEKLKEIEKEYKLYLAKKQYIS